MSDRSSKRARILALSRNCNNASALERELRLLREDPGLLDVVRNRKTIGRSLDKLWEKIGQRHILQLDPAEDDDSDGEDTFTWSTLSLRNVFELLVAESEEFRAQLTQLYGRRPCTPDAPWDIIFNFDEATPGMVLSLNNRRKMWTIMVTLKQFGPEVLQHEAAWIPIACLRSSKARQIPGVFSAASRFLMRDWFVEAPRLQEEGLLLTIGPNRRPVLLFMKFGNTLCDEDAMKKFWSAKGASGLQPCWKCWISGVRDGSSLADFDVTGTMVDIRCGNAAEFQLIDDHSRYVQANVLARSRATLSITRFKQLEQAYGLTYNPHALLWDDRLHNIVLPQSGSRYDAAHCFFCNGMVNEELDLLLERLEEQCRIGFKELQAYFGATWRAASCFNGRKDKLSKIDAFSKARANHWKKAGKFRPNAKDLLTLVPVMAHFLQTVLGIAEKIPAETASFILLAKVVDSSLRGARIFCTSCQPICCRKLRKSICNQQAMTFLKVVDLVKRGKRGEPLATQLQQSLTQWASLSEAAYGRDDRIPKFHFAQHVPDQLRQDGFIQDCFATERQNSMWITAADNVENTISFEKSVVLRAFNAHFAKLQQLKLDGLIGERRCESLGVDSFMASSMQWKGNRFWSEDVVVLDDDDVAVVLACFRSGTNLGFVASMLQREKRVTPASCQYKRSDATERTLIMLSDCEVRLATAWHFVCEDRLLVIH